MIYLLYCFDYFLSDFYWKEGIEGKGGIEGGEGIEGKEGKEGKERV